MILKNNAESHRTNVELRDPQSNYNKTAVADIDKKMPVLDGKYYGCIACKADSVNLSQPAYYTKLNDLLNTVPIATWKTYLRFHVIDNASNLLSNLCCQQAFEYSGKTLSGQKEMRQWEQIYR